MVAAVVEMDQRTLAPAYCAQRQANNKRPYEAGSRHAQQTEAVVCWTYENGKMRHMPVDFGLGEGCMRCMCPAGLPTLPELLGGAGW